MCSIEVGKMSGMFNDAFPSIPLQSLPEVAVPQPTSYCPELMLPPTGLCALHLLLSEDSEHQVGRLWAHHHQSPVWTQFKKQQ